MKNVQSRKMKAQSRLILQTLPEKKNKKKKCMHHTKVLMYSAPDSIEATFPTVKLISHHYGIILTKWLKYRGCPHMVPNGKGKKI